jgi:hypothetical protein
MWVADREGFEHLHTLSKRARSTTPPPVRFTTRANAREVAPGRAG